MDCISFFWFEKTTQIVNTLTNGFFLIHPIFIFLTYLISFFILFKKKKNLIMTHIIFSITAIFLGSWWANQELGWGGWWSWDFVEIINLLLVLIGLVWLHNKPRNLNLNLNFLCVFYFFIFLHLSIRYDFFNSIHSFISSFNIEYKYCYFIILLSFNIIFLEKINYKIFDFNIFMLKLLLICYILKIVFMYKIHFIKNEYIWYFYIFVLFNYFNWIFLNKFSKINISISSLNFFYYTIQQLKNIFKNMSSFITHFSIILVFFVYFFAKQFDYFLEFDLKKSPLYYNISDFLICKKKNLEIWYCMGILDESNISDRIFIPLYNYNVILDNFLTSNSINFSFYNYYFDILILSTIIILLQIFKNIIYSYTKYKIWCI